MKSSNVNFQAQSKQNATVASRPVVVFLVSLVVVFGGCRELQTGAELESEERLFGTTLGATASSTSLTMGVNDSDDSSIWRTDGDVRLEENAIEQSPASESVELEDNLDEPGELYYGNGGLAKLRAMALDHQPALYANAKSDLIDGLLEKAERYLDCEYTVERKGWEYSFVNCDVEEPLSHGSNYPHWTPLFQEGPNTISSQLHMLAFAWLVTEDTRYAEAAKKMALSLAGWSTWSDPEVVIWPWAWTDGLGDSAQPAGLDTAHATIAMAYVYEALRGYLFEDEALAIRTAIYEKGLVALKSASDRVVDMYGDYVYLQAHNITGIIVAALGLGSAALLQDEAEALDWFLAAKQMSENYIALQGSDGGLLESHLYGSYALQQIVRLYLVAENLGYTVENGPFWGNVSSFYYSALAPDGRTIGTFGDSKAHAASVDASFLHVLASRGDQVAQAYLVDAKDVTRDSSGQLVSLINKIDHLTVYYTAGDLEPNRMNAGPWYSNESGFGSVSSGRSVDQSLLVFKAGPKDTELEMSHNHYDDLSYQIWADGAWLVGDPGYAMDSEDRYGRAHSTIVVDETPLQQRNAAEITFAGGGTGFGVMCGEIGAEGYADADGNSVVNKVERCVQMHSDGFVVVHDVVDAEGAQELTQLVQAADGTVVSVDSEQNVATVYAPQAKLTVVPVDASVETRVQDGTISLNHELNSVGGGGRHRSATLLYPSANLGFNGFESSDDVAGWVARSRVGVSGAMSQNETFEGNGALQVSVTSESTDEIGYYYAPKVGVEPGTAVALTVMAKSQMMADAYGAYMVCFFYDGDEYRGNKASASLIKGSSAWAQLDWSCEVPEDANQVMIALQVKGIGDVWFDNFQSNIDNSVSNVSGDENMFIFDTDAGRYAVANARDAEVDSSVGDETVVLDAGFSAQRLANSGVVQSLSIVDGSTYYSEISNTWTNIAMSDNANLSLERDEDHAAITISPSSADVPVTWFEMQLSDSDELLSATVNGEEARVVHQDGQATFCWGQAPSGLCSAAF